MTAEPTGFYDSHGIPVYVGDLIRVKHYRHYRNRRQMWLYFRVAKIGGRYVIQNWNNLNNKQWQTALSCSEVDMWGEVVAESGLQRNARGDIITFNERPRKATIAVQEREAS